MSTSITQYDMYQLIKKNTWHQIIDHRHKVKNGKKTLIFSIKKIIIIKKKPIPQLNEEVLKSSHVVEEY